jgi:hypothetical protein
MIEPDESRVTVALVEIGPIGRQDVSVEVDLHEKKKTSNAQRSTLNVQLRKNILLMLMILLMIDHKLKRFNVLPATASQPPNKS